MYVFRKFICLCICLGVPTLSNAQDQPIALNEADIVPVEPTSEAPDKMLGTLLFRDDTALQVIDLLETLTGKIILRRQDISPAKINFNSNGPISQKEAILALESLLTLNGIMLTDMGGRFMKAVPATNVNSHVPEMLIGSTLELDPSQQIYAKLFKFDYLDAEQISGTLVQPLLSQNSNMVLFAKSNALLITDALVNLQRIENIINETDRAQSIREEIKFIKLDFVQAPEMQERLENLIEGPLKSYLEGNTSVTADERTNQLILITHPGNTDTIMRVIDSIDVDAAPLTGSEVFQLRQAKAEEVVPIIEDIISGQKEGREEDAKIARDNESDRPNNNTSPNAPNVTNPSTVTASTTSATEPNSSLQFSNFVGLSADERTNSIVAYGTKQDLATLGELIEKIDIPLPQVLIEAVITQVSLSENQASGLTSLGFTYDGATETFSSIIAGTAGGISFTDGTISLDNPSDFTLSSAINPTNTDGDTRTLSTPRVVVSHNEEGVINVSRSQPIITSSTTFSNSDNNTRSSVEYRDIGIQLTVTPLIGADGTVQMVIEQKVEEIIDNVTIDGNDQPVIGVREATSTISVVDGQIIVLGGLQQNTGTDSNSYFPLIGKLPLVRELLGNSSNTYNRTEVIIFIRPTVLHNPSEAQGLSADYIEKASEKEVIEKYIEESSTKDAYLKGSKFESEETKPFIRIRVPEF